MRQLTIICDEEWADYVRSLIGIREHGEVFAIADDVRVCPSCGESLGDDEPECADDDMSSTESMACDR